MEGCININSLEYQTLKNRSGIPDLLLKGICRKFIDKYGRFPKLDEISGSNSEPHLREFIKMKKDSAKVENILKATGTNTIQEATVSINNEYRDLETTISPIVEDAFVDIQHRPTTNNQKVTPVLLSKYTDDYEILINSLNKLSKLYGINVNKITSKELNTEQWRQIIPEGSAINAFIYNGEIYINTDRGRLDSPIHEMFHLFIGSIRFTDPNLFLELMDLVELLPNYKLLTSKYPNRTRNDVNEEILITELSKYLVGSYSEISNIDNKLLYEITYNIKRVLDTVLMGLDSVKLIPELKLFLLTLRDLAQEVNSSIMLNEQHLNTRNAALHRKLNNLKLDLSNKGFLKELCD